MTDRRYAAFGKAYKNREEPERKGFEELPEGDFKVIIGKPALGYSRNKENPRFQMKWPLTVTEGDMEGKTVNKFHGLDATENKSAEQMLGYLTSDMQRLGLTPPEWANEYEKNPEMLLEAIVTECEKAEGAEVEIAVVKKGDFTNIYFNSEMSASVRPSPAPKGKAPAVKTAAKPVVKAPAKPQSKAASLFRR